MAKRPPAAARGQQVSLQLRHHWNEQQASWHTCQTPSALRLAHWPAAPHGSGARDTAPVSVTWLPAAASGGLQKPGVSLRQQKGAEESSQGGQETLAHPALPRDRDAVTLLTPQRTETGRGRGLRTPEPVQHPRGCCWPTSRPGLWSFPRSPPCWGRDAPPGYRPQPCLLCSPQGGERPTPSKPQSWDLQPLPIH